MPGPAYEDYRRAESFLPWHVDRVIFTDAVEPHWLEDGHRFWYERRSARGKEFVLIDAERNRRRLAFDHAQLADALSEAAGQPFPSNQLPFDTIELLDPDHALRFVADGRRWQCDLQTYACAAIEMPAGPAADELASPNGAWAAYVRDHNLFVRSLIDTGMLSAHGRGAVRQLTRDGESFYGYAGRAEYNGTYPITDRILDRTVPPYLFWSPDSTKLITYRLDQRRVGELHVMQTVPPDGSARPILHSYRYGLPGDEHLATAQLTVFDLAQDTVVPLQYEPLHIGLKYGLQMPEMWWNANSSRVYFLHEERGSRVIHFVVADAASGSCRRLLTEEAATTIFPGPTPCGPALIRVLGNGEEFIWYSTRDGWGHLYLYDGVSGELKTQITAGPWTVRDIIHVDEEGRWLYFLAGGREPTRDPYFRHLYRSRLDGSELGLLTPEDADHAISFAPSGEYLVDTYSRVDLPPVSVLRSADGRLIRTLEEGDVSALLARGWRFPERFHAKARDGVTDLYGVLVRPSNFDPAKRYPVIDSMYPGPQAIKTPKGFSGVRDRMWLWLEQSFAELGCIVMTLDGPGTPYRSKAFLDAGLGDHFGEAGGIPDHVAALRQLATRFPEFDLDRVAAFGHSAGGFAATRAMLLYPDVYEVGVASSANHDQRAFLWDWGERWIGRDLQDYPKHANASLAGNLKGKLLLSFQELDEGGNHTATMQFIDTLVAANKDFDLLVLPNGNHPFFDLRWGRDVWEQCWDRQIFGHPYLFRRWWDYFVRHLLGASPPAGYAIGGFPPDAAQTRAERSSRAGPPAPGDRSNRCRIPRET